MMKIKAGVKTSDYFKKRIIRFIIKYGDGHITKRAINWLKKTPFSEIKKENGDLIHVLLDNSGKIIAILAIAKYGLEQAIIVIHPNTRKKGIAKIITSEALEDIDRYYVKVANDNIASLKLCFSLGMHAFSLTKGPTGKPTLILGMGSWLKEEWEEYRR